MWKSLSTSRSSTAETLQACATRFLFLSTAVAFVGLKDASYPVPLEFWVLPWLMALAVFLGSLEELMLGYSFSCRYILLHFCVVPLRMECSRITPLYTNFFGVVHFCMIAMSFVLYTAAWGFHICSKDRPLSSDLKGLELGKTFIV